jgi:flagella basal body P-ring formation protein FlgA
MEFFRSTEGASAMTLPLCRVRSQAPGKRPSLIARWPIWLSLIAAPLLHAEPSSPRAARAAIDHAITAHLTARAQAEAARHAWRGWQLSHKSVPLGDALPRRCAQTLQVSAGAPASSVLERQRLALHCADGAGWTLTVSTQASIRVQALVAARDIERRQVLTLDQLQWRALDLARQPRGVITDPKAITGMSARRRLRAGQPLSANLLEPALLVRRGERVSIVARDGPIQARTEGEALAAGRLGEVIEVKNLSSGKVVQVSVVEVGVVSSGGG